MDLVAAVWVVDSTEAMVVVLPEHKGCTDHNHHTCTVDNHYSNLDMHRREAAAETALVGVMWVAVVQLAVVFHLHCRLAVGVVVVVGRASLVGVAASLLVVEVVASVVLAGMGVVGGEVLGLVYR